RTPRSDNRISWRAPNVSKIASQLAILLLALALGYSGALAATATVPSAPKSLAVASVSMTQVSLKWQDRSNNETGFSVPRAATSTGPWTQVGTTGPGKVTYTDAGLTPGTAYSYRVLAFNAAGYSSPTNVVTATTTKDTTAPSVSITSPASGVTYTAPQTVT